MNPFLEINLYKDIPTFVEIKRLFDYQQEGFFIFTPELFKPGSRQREVFSIGEAKEFVLSIKTPCIVSIKTTKESYISLFGLDTFHCYIKNNGRVFLHNFQYY